MWYLKISDGREDGVLVTHGPFKSEREAERWWDKICDDILSEYEAYCMRCGTGRKRPLSNRADDIVLFRCNDYYNIIGRIIFKEKEGKQNGDCVVLDG